MTKITKNTLTGGFTNWKDATRQFTKYESCEFHKLAVAALSVRVGIAEMMSKQVSQERKVNHDQLMTVLSREIPCSSRTAFAWK